MSVHELTAQLVSIEVFGLSSVIYLHLKQAYFGQIQNSKFLLARLRNLFQDFFFFVPGNLGMYIFIPGCPEMTFTAVLPLAQS